MMLEITSQILHLTTFVHLNNYTTCIIKASAGLHLLAK